MSYITSADAIISSPADLGPCAFCDAPITAESGYYAWRTGTFIPACPTCYETYTALRWWAAPDGHGHPSTR